MKIKVCGLRDPENIKAVTALKPDLIGFICYGRSPRYVTELSADLLDSLPADIVRTGVFVNESFDNIVDKITEFDLGAVQLHGDEGVWVCDALKNKEQIIVTRGTDVTADGMRLEDRSSETTRTVQLNKYVTVIKAFGIDDSFDFGRLNDYADSVDYFLFDTKTSGYGGSGKTFDWAILDNYKLDKPFLLSGGISLDNLAQIKQIDHPAFYGVDLNSKFEIEPGFKDIEKLEQAFKILRTA